MIGSTLSHYRILDELGRGGMGIVYKAEDTKLDRTVALKVLPAAALSSEDDRIRFYREAKAAAQLNHPHIAAVHEIDEAVPEGAHADDKRPFIAMEFIDGKSLEAKAKEGPMALEEVVRLSMQVANALEAAHEKNIVHRDIKSANIMLTAKGDAKVLDFGLAKTAHSTMLTRMGSTLGTISYMSPEQARGENVDYRTDLWALGIIMYELIAGRLPFGGDYEQAVTYSILNEDAQPLTAIRTGVPMGLEWIVSKLLAKKAEDRYQSAKDLIVDLRTVDLTQTGMSRATSVQSMPAASASQTTPKANSLDVTGRINPVVLVSIVVLAGLLGWWLGHSPAQHEISSSVKRVTQTLPIGGIVAAMDISDDGRYVAIARETIQLLDLSTGEIRDLKAPDVYINLAFSRDGKQLLMTTATAIRLMTLDSGSVIEVAKPKEGGPRAEWLDDQTIIYEEFPSIWTMSLTTGDSRQLTVNDSLAGEYDMDYPSLLPDGKTFVATVQQRDGPDRFGFFDRKTGKIKGYADLQGTKAQYIDSGYLIFNRENALLAAPFDLDRLEVTGPVISIEQDVRVEARSISKEGTLIHAGLNVGTVSAARPLRPLVIQQEEGSFVTENQGREFPSGIYRSAAVHPSGTMAAVVVEETRGGQIVAPSDIWILDFASGSRRSFTSGGISDYPAWNPAGDSLYFVRRTADNARTIMRKSLNGSSGETTILESGNATLVDLVISPDGTKAALAAGIPTLMDSQSWFIIFDLKNSQRNSYRVEDMVRDGPGGNPLHFDFSPDSRYLAFEDQGAIYVQSVENLDSPPYLVWENGKSLPKWSADGKTLFAMNVDSGGESRPVSLENGFSIQGAAEDLSSNWYAFGTNFFDTFPSSDRFLFGLPVSGESDVQEEGLEQTLDLYMILNLTSELRGTN
jgi:serine/threonine protein kinase